MTYDKRNVNVVMLFIIKIQVTNGMRYKRATHMSKSENVI